MIDKLVGSSSIALLERTVNFTEQRHQLILENLANVSVPGYLQKDVSVNEFQQSLAKTVALQHQVNDTNLTPKDTSTIRFQGNSVTLKPKPVTSAQPFYDRGARSMEELMGQLADNATAHNVATAMLKGKYDTLQKAITMRA